MLDNMVMWMQAAFEDGMPIAKHALEIFLGYALLHFVLYLLSRSNIAVWSWLYYWLNLKTSLLWPFRLWRYRKSHSFVLVSLDDYVSILENLRNKIVERCKNKTYASNARPEISLYVYTMQLPSDWPLWHLENEVDWGKNALEQYFVHLHGFLQNAHSDHYTVSLKRVIVVDNCDSPKGKARRKELIRDVKSTYYQKYINMLHDGSDENARVCFYPRSWPSWLSDAVFYGVKDPSSSKEWLWGVTTSYNAGEDLVLLRVHKFRRHPLGKAYSPGKGLVLPYDYQNLEELANDAANNTDRFHTLKSLNNV